MTADVEHKPLTQVQLDIYEIRELRRWCVEQALNAFTHAVVRSTVVELAAEYEQYVLNGHTPKGEPDGNR